MSQHFGRSPVLKCRGTVGLTRINLNPLGITMDWAAVFDVAYFLDVSSSAVADDGAPAGTGAQIVRIIGLDNDYNRIYEDVILNGQTIVTTAKKFLRVFAAYTKARGTGLKNAGDIYILKAGTGGVYVAGVPPTLTSAAIKMLAGNNLGYSGLFTVPRGMAYAVKLVLASGMTQDATVTIVQGNAADSSFKGPMDILKIQVTDGTGPSDQDGSWPIAEKTDIYVQALCVAASGIINCTIYFERTLGVEFVG